MGRCWEAGLTEGKDLGHGRDVPQPEVAGQVSADPACGTRSAQALCYSMSQPPHGFLLISDRERRPLPPAMIPTVSGSKLVRRL